MTAPESPTERTQEFTAYERALLEDQLAEKRHRDTVRHFALGKATLQEVATARQLWESARAHLLTVQAQDDGRNPALRADPWHGIPTGDNPLADVLGPLPAAARVSPAYPGHVVGAQERVLSILPFGGRVV